MFKKVVTLVLVGLILNTAVVKAAHADSKEALDRSTAKMKEKVRKLGTGPEARIEVKLQDKRKLKGYVKEAGEESFVVVDQKTGSATIIAYAQVKQVKTSSCLTAGKVALGVAKGAAIVGGIALGFTLLALIYIPKT